MPPASLPSCAINAAFSSGLDEGSVREIYKIVEREAVAGASGDDHRARMPKQMFAATGGASTGPQCWIRRRAASEQEVGHGVCSGNGTSG